MKPLSYRSRLRLKRIGLGVLAALLLVIAAAAGVVIYLERYVVYTDEGAYLSFLHPADDASADKSTEVDASLSGGEVKRIEIASLMARELGVAIFDEPEAGIDLWSFAMLVESFKMLCRGRHKSVILISHQERIMQLADEIIVVADGKIRSQGSKEEIFPELLGEFSQSCGFRGKEAAAQ